MSHSHPNRSRSRKGPGSNPKPEQIRKLRQLHALTQTEAAEFVYATLRAWQQWEGGQRRMHPAIWQWFRHQVFERRLEAAEEQADNHRSSNLPKV